MNYDLESIISACGHYFDEQFVVVQMRREPFGSSAMFFAQGVVSRVHQPVLFDEPLNTHAASCNKGCGLFFLVELVGTIHKVLSPTIMSFFCPANAET